MNQDCPLCDNPASYEISHEPYCKHFTCSVCTEFFIDASSEAHIVGLPGPTKVDRRKKLSAMAVACPDDHVFVIRKPRDDERGGSGHGVAKTEMISECLSRDRT